MANKITAIDRKVDDLEQKIEGYTSQGLRFGGALNSLQRAEDDEERIRLLAQRAELVKRMKNLFSEE